MSERRCMSTEDFTRLPWDHLRVEFTPRGDTRARRSHRWRRLRRAYHCMMSDRLSALLAGAGASLKITDTHDPF